ncbi:MAG: MSCRAMM family adhesin SdrC [Lachnospiraceae bacterium]|nr:MSCRAMM family adhesin SdrC [Lachnospiraceae bacterium]
MMKKKIFKKAMSLFVAMSLCVTSIPTSAFASETGLSTEIETENTVAVVSETEDSTAAVSEEVSSDGGNAASEDGTVLEADEGSDSNADNGQNMDTNAGSSSESDAGSEAELSENTNVETGVSTESGSEDSGGSETKSGEEAETNTSAGSGSGDDTGNSTGSGEDAGTNAEGVNGSESEQNTENTSVTGTGNSSGSGETCVHGNSLGACAACVQELINALPSADELAGMDADSLNAVYEQMQAAYDACEALTAENQALVDTALLTTLFDYFSGLSSEASETGNTEESEKIVNAGVVIKMDSENELPVETGKNHKVTIKTSFSATNDGDKATVRVYMQDAEGNMNTVATLLDLTDDQIVYASEDNSKLTITVTHAYEYDENGNKTAEYLEYVMPAGTSVEMELEFYVPTGIYGTTETLVLVPEITHTVGDGANDSVCDKLSLEWTSSFLWENLEKTASVSKIRANLDGSLSNDITYTFSVDMNKAATGVVWTKSTSVSENITLPEGMELKNDGIYAGETQVIAITCGSCVPGERTF